MKVPETLRPTARAALLLFLIFALGTVGFAVIGGRDHSLLDALYMTTITLTTVGYEEAIDLTARPGAQLFTVVLLLSGVGTFVYFFSNLTAFVVEGTLERLFWRRRMTRQIERLTEHYVVCGGGRTGEHVVRELVETRRPFVLVDEDGSRVRDLHTKFEQEFPAVIGDATEDDVLLAAGVDRASGLVTCLSADKDNILVTFTARNLSSRVRIVARCVDVSAQQKLVRAGANSVVSPDRIGGLRLISEMLRPTVVSFLDVMLRDSDQPWRVEEVRVGVGSELEGVTLGALRRRGRRDFLLLAARTRDGAWKFNPEDEMTLDSETSLVFMGSPEARTSLEAEARSSATQT